MDTEGQHAQDQREDQRASGKTRPDVQLPAADDAHGDQRVPQQHTGAVAYDFRIDGPDEVRMTAYQLFVMLLFSRSSTPPQLPRIS